MDQYNTVPNHSKTFCNVSGKVNLLQLLMKTDLNNIVQHCYTRSRLSNIVLILLITMNIVGSKTLLNSVELQALQFLLCLFHAELRHLLLLL